MRHVNNGGMVAFHVFQAIPFVYELRALLVSCLGPLLLVCCCLFTHAVCGWHTPTRFACGLINTYSYLGSL